MNILVLCGGISSEREISLRSSVKVADALHSRGHNVVMADVFFGTEAMMPFDSCYDYQAIADELRTKNDLIIDELIEKTGLFGPNIIDMAKACDIVFIGLHGENGEDGRIQAEFDRLNIKYTGSGSYASSLAMSKKATKDKLSHLIRMPKGLSLNREDFAENSDKIIEMIKREISLPCVIKPSNGGSSLGVVIIRSEDELFSAISEDFNFDDTLLAEEYIEGRELTQAVLNGQALPAVEICPEEGVWYDYTYKYNGLMKELCPAPITDDIFKEMSDISVRFGELLGLTVYYRIDYLMDKEGRLYALEANSLPGMTDTSLVPQEAKAVGIEYADLCELIIKYSLEKYSENRE